MRGHVRPRSVPVFDAVVKRGKDSEILAIRFWMKVDQRGPDECWPWLGAKRVGRGYVDGRFKIDPYTTAIAPRVAFVLGTKIDPGVALVLHTCDNSLCCNPAHLYLGTQADNNRDTITGNRCPRRCKNKPGGVGQKMENEIGR